jgi:TrmH family RNA methyltransferase
MNWRRTTVTIFRKPRINAALSFIAKLKHQSSKTMQIESRANAKFKLWSSLLEARGIKKAQLALVSGPKIVREFLEQNPRRALDLLLPSDDQTVAVPAHVRVHRLTKPLFKELDSMGTNSALLVVEAGELPTWKAEPPHGLELIVALSDPGNLGAALRSAEALGVSRVILTQEACSPFLPKAIRASSGASLRMPMAVTGALPSLSVSAYALNMRGTDITKFAWPKDLYLVLGEEGRGVPASLLLKPLSIYMRGASESLNATTAAAIAMFSYASFHR